MTPWLVCSLWGVTTTGESRQPRHHGPHQVLEDQRERLVGVDNVVQRDDVGVLQVFEQGDCRRTERRVKTFSFALIQKC